MIIFQINPNILEGRITYQIIVILKKMFLNTKVTTVIIFQIVPNFLKGKITCQTIVILKRISLNTKVITMIIFQINPNILEGIIMCQIIVRKSNGYDDFSNSSKSPGKKNNSST